MTALGYRPARCRGISAAAFLLAALGCDDSAVPVSRTEPTAVPEPTLVTTIVSTDSLSFNAVDVGVGPGTRILVLDSDAWQILVFDSSGRMLSRIGREGSGPGEIRVAKDLEVGMNGTMAVADVGNARIGFWSPDGRWLGQSTLRRWVHDLAWIPAGLFAKQESAGGLQLRRVVWDDSGGSEVAGALLPRALMDSTGMNWEFGPVDVLSPGRGLFAYPDSVYVVMETDSIGQVVTTFQRHDVERVPLSSAEREVIAARFRQAAAQRPGLPMAEPPEFKRLIMDIAADDRGRLWILRSTLDGVDAEFDVFGPDGSYLGIVRVPSPVRRFELQGEYLIAYGESDVGESAVSLYTYSTRTLP